MTAPKNTQMKYRRLGNSPLEVSELCLGTMMFGDQTDAAAAGDIVAHARAHGVNFIDTADVYTNGASERILGPLLAKDRDAWVLATKVGNKMSERPNESRYSRKWMMRAAEDSLQRLGTDYIDLWYLHRDFERDSLEEPVRVAGDLIRAGKIRYWGVSNFRGWRIAELVRLADEMNVPRPVACQPYYNLLNRMPEAEILPACGHYGLGVVPYSPVARGILTGKYLPGQAAPEGTRAARGDKRMLQTEWRPESLEIARRLGEHAHGRGVDLLHFAVAWLLANRAISSVIAGPRTLEQWQQYFGAVGLAWGAQDEAIVDSMVPSGHPSTPGYSDPAYPLTGRRV